MLFSICYSCVFFIQGHFISSFAYEYAAAKGHLETGEWLLSNTHQIIEYEAYIHTVEGGNTKLMEALFRHHGTELPTVDYHWEDTVFTAAYEGHCDFLKWALENGSAKLPDAYKGAKSANKTETMQWLVDNGWPIA